MKRYCSSGKKDRDKERLWGLLVRDLPKPLVHEPGHACSVWPWRSRGRTRWTQTAFSISAVLWLWFYKSQVFLLKYVSICALSTSPVPWNTLLRWKTQVHCHLRHISPVFPHQCQLKGEMWSAVLEGDLIPSQCWQSLKWVVFLPFIIEYN